MENMKKLLNISIIALVVIFFSSCQIDNYEEPQETVYGEIIDKNTGKPLLVAVGDCEIQLEELSWGESPNPFRFKTKTNGEFYNSKVFKGKYRVTPVFGAFIPVEGKEVEISGKTHVSFEVEPYLNVAILNVRHTGNKVSVDYKITSSCDKYQITDARLFTSYVQFVGSSSFLNNYSPIKDFSGTPNADIYGVTQTIEVDNLPSGHSFYFRIGARVDDPVKKYNYSEISQYIKIP